MSNVGSAGVAPRQIDPNGARAAAQCPHLAGFDPLLPDQRDDPHDWLRLARAESPVFYLEKYKLWCVTTHEHAMGVYKDLKTFSSRAQQQPMTPMPESIAATLDGVPLCQKGNLNFTDPPEHMRLKRILSPAFAKAIDGIEPWITNYARDVAATFTGRTEIEIIGEYTWKLPVAVMAKLLGVDQTDSDRFRTWAEAHFELVGGGTLSPERAEHCWRCAVELDRFGKELVTRRRSEPGDDFLSRLLGLQAEGARISDEEIVTAGLSMVRAGTDTSSQTLGQTILLLLKHPEQLAELRANRGLVDNAIEEVLRLRGPVRGAMRTTMRDVRLGDVTIPEGETVYIHLGSASRDEAVFENADAFDIRRPNANKHLEFGALNRFCLGAPVARPTVKAGLNALLDQFSEFRLSPRQGALVYSASLLVPSLKSMLIEVR